MAGLEAGPEGPGTLYTQAEPRPQSVGTPFPVPPPHWGHPGRLHHCWHPDEKVNIEPKDLGVVGQLGVPREGLPFWDQLGSPRVYQRERAPSTTWGKGQTGAQARRNCGVCSLHPQARRGLFGYVVF